MLPENIIETQHHGQYDSTMIRDLGLTMILGFDRCPRHHRKALIKSSWRVSLRSWVLQASLPLPVEPVLALLLRSHLVVEDIPGKVGAEVKLGVRRHLRPRRGGVIPNNMEWLIRWRLHSVRGCRVRTVD